MQAEKAEFHQMVKQLWDTHVRTELIYGKKLRFCKTCFAFFYQTDAESDHPNEETESVQKFFGDAGITSQSKLGSFLWKALSRVKGFQPSLNNILTGKHRLMSITEQQTTIPLLELNALHIKIAQQQKQLAELTKKVEDFQTERHLLLKENEELMGEFLKARSLNFQDLAKIHRLCAEIGTLCHSRCGCEPLNQQ